MVKEKSESPQSRGERKKNKWYGKPPVDKRFGQPNGNPRHNGAWKKEDTPRFKIEQMMKMNDDELIKIRDDSDRPKFERTFANAVYSGDIELALKLVNQVYGKPAQANLNVNVNEVNEDEIKRIKGFVLPKFEE